MNFTRQRELSPAAADLVQFDSDSIRQTVQAQRHATPDFWLADPDAYERNGRVLRDSDSPRLLAYSSTDRVLYATDGCNTCTRRLEVNLESLPAGKVQEFADANELRVELLQKLIDIVANGAS